MADTAWRLRKARTLVKLLALSPEHRLHREQVIEALWPDGDASAASNNLRQAVYVSRRALDSIGEDGAQRLELSQDVLTLGADHLAIDVEQFEAAAAAAISDPSVPRLMAALECYGGELLPEDRFEPWAAPRRDALREQHLALLLTLARLHSEAGAHDLAITALQNALADDPFSERVHRELMRVYALSGRRQRALAQFHLLRDSLRREYADEPEAQTREVYRELLSRDGDGGDGHGHSGGDGDGDATATATATARSPTRPRPEPRSRRPPGRTTSRSP